MIVMFPITVLHGFHNQQILSIAVHGGPVVEVIWPA